MSLFRSLAALFEPKAVEVHGQTGTEAGDWEGFAPVQIWVGLGNPGAQYAMHRHNVGFMAVDAIAETHGFEPPKKSFHGWAQQGRIGGERILLLKPETFMNESGRAVRAAMDFFKKEIGDVTIFHDELDLAPFKVKVKTGGGTAGHNGLRSIDQHLGPDSSTGLRGSFRRVRIGIGHPGDKALVHSYVLSDFARSEEPWAEDLCRACGEFALLLARGEDASFQNKVHLAMEARGWGDVKRPGEAGATAKKE